ncbi:hypothetical protein KSP40_PGU009417 [Platanthera guangdongensis]|uniref:Uncharacterized protein n=1 Tax=Platanthera guangdongensis TaxID=2320717 RepID=A0ABR2MTR1_9ASPA
MAAEIPFNAPDPAAPNGHLTAGASTEAGDPGYSELNACWIQLPLSPVSVSATPPSKETKSSAAYEGICQSKLRSGENCPRRRPVANGQPRRSPRTAANISAPSSENKRPIVVADQPYPEGSVSKKPKNVSSTSSLKKLEDVNGSSFFIGDPVPAEEAMHRWPHHYARHVSVYFVIFTCKCFCFISCLSALVVACVCFAHFLCI